MATAPIPPGYRAGRAFLIVIQVLVLVALLVSTVGLVLAVVDPAGTPPGGTP